MSNFATHADVTVGTDADGSGSDEILYGEFAGGQVHIPGGSTITSLTWLSTHKEGGDYEAAQHSVDDGVTPLTYVATVQTVAANKSYPIPPELFGAYGLKVVGDNAGTVHVSLKGT